MNQYGATLKTATGSFSRFVARYLLFWLLFFLICRAVFVMYNFSATVPLPVIANAFWCGMRIDLSTAGYLTVVPLLITFVHSLVPTAKSRLILSVYTIVMLCVAAILVTVDLELYSAWGTKLNAQALAYLKYPQEAMASVSFPKLLQLTCICLVLFAAGFTLYAVGVKNMLRVEPGSGRSFYAVLCRTVVFVLFAALLLLAIRGGTGVAPINPSFAYFSSYQFANHTALNTAWSLLYDVKHHLRNKQNQFVYMSTEEMLQRKEILSGAGARNDTELILTSARPNIICILLESWTADVIRSLGGVDGLTPNFERLIADGLLFTNVYSVASRTSYAIPAVLSGFPSTPNNDVMSNPRLMERLPAISATLKSVGYTPAFYYGGDDHFDNMHAYFLSAGFATIINKSAFDKSAMNGRWGANDSALYDKVLGDLRSASKPFFTAILTLSSHEPYDVPMQTVVRGNDESSLFKNAMVYADRALGEFMKKAAAESWYKDTLFVLVADHGHRLPLGREAHVPEKFHIPLLLFGDVVQKKFRGVRKVALGSQTDIPATLLGQLHLDHHLFEWSNDLLNHNRNNHAFYVFKNGFGWITGRQTIGYDTLTRKTIFTSEQPSDVGMTAETVKDGQAYMQYIAAKFPGL